MLELEKRGLAAELMTEFAERTGLSSDRPVRRYLWTDAFAVCNFLALDRPELALALVDQVHEVLGSHRGDDGRTGWLADMSDEEAAVHPTRGGLRIGKKLPERGAHDAYDAELEWERDGQYFHYATRWMHALDQVARWTDDPRGNLWARELAQVVHRAFTYAPQPSTSKRMYWKMSIDLSRPLVSAMGQHDPLDGLVTYLQLHAHRDATGPDLVAEIDEMASIAAETELGTDDPLGVGSMLTDAYRLEQLVRASLDVGRMVAPLLVAAGAGVHSFLSTRALDRPLRKRLAFRELGLALGLRAAEHIAHALAIEPSPLADDPRVRSSLARVRECMWAADAIETAWLDPDARRLDVWREHHDIDDVMLATCLVPGGWLSLRTNVAPATQPLRAHVENAGS